MAGGDEADGGSDEEEDGEDDEDAAEAAAAGRLQRGFLGGEGLVGNYVRVGEMGKTHGLIASVNGMGMGSVQ